MRVLSLVLLVACGGGAPAAPAKATAATAATTAAAAPSPECLAKVDKADGTEDHVGHKCPNCGLGMEGADDQVTKIEGYELHSCSADCKHALDADPGKVLARACQGK
jgi:hypothetical protein